jgi:hypothetical protein
LFAQNEYYWVAAADSQSILLYYNNGTATPASANNPNGTQIAVYNTNGINGYIARLSFLRAAPAANSPFNKILSVTLVGADYGTAYYVSSWMRDDFGVGGTPRLRFEIKRTSDDVVMTNLTGTPGGISDGAGMVGIKEFNLVEVAGSGVTGRLIVDFGPDTGSGNGAPFNQVVSGDIANWRVMFNPSQEIAIEDIVEAGLVGGNTDSPFVSTVTDAYMKSLITKARIEGGDIGERYVINYRTEGYPGIPLYRVRFYIYDTVLGVTVAQWAKDGSTDFTPTLPDTVFLMNAGLGTPLSNYNGVSAMLWIDWSQIDWSHTVDTAYNYITGGVKVENIITNGEMDDFLFEYHPYEVRTFGNGLADYPTWLAAVQSTYFNPAGVTRTAFPISDVCSYSRQVVFECVQDGYTEVITPVNPLGVDQSPVVLPPYSTTILRPDTVISMNAYAGSAPVIENPFSSRIIGGTLRQNGAGYVIHEDFSNLSLRSNIVGDLSVTNFKIRHVYEGVKLVAAAGACPVAMWGAGTANAAKTIFKGATLIREGTGETGDYFSVHNSSSQTDPGRIEFWNCYTNSFDQASNSADLVVIKQYPTDIQHKIVVNNCDFKEISYAPVVGGVSGYIREGYISPNIIYPSDINP